jgi:hypothetical protein
MIMPGKAEIGLKYYQELARGLDEGRAKVISLNEVLETPVGKFKDVLKTKKQHLWSQERKSTSSMHPE